MPVKLALLENHPGNHDAPWLAKTSKLLPRKHFNHQEQRCKWVSTVDPFDPLTPANSNLIKNSQAVKKGAAPKKDKVKRM